MTYSPHDNPHPFLSIVTWPPESTRDSLAQLLGRSTGLDVPTLRLRLGQAPPSIVGQVEPEEAARAVRAIRALGGDAFSVTLADLYTLGPAKQVRAMSIAHGVLGMQLRGGEQAAVRFQNVWLLVQGMIREAVRETPVVRSPQRLRAPLSGRSSAGIASRVGAAGLAAFFGGAYMGEMKTLSVSTTETRIRNKLHIHIADGSIFEVQGRQFDFSILGEMKEYNIRANMERLCELLSHLAPDEIVDPYFPMWKPPPRHQQLRIEGEAAQADRPFAFYSRWVALMYRHILEGTDQQRFESE